MNAAAIKMDELLVSWLGSDNVYEEVLRLVEKYRSSSVPGASPPSSPIRGNSLSSNDPNNNKDNDYNDNEDSSNASPRGVTVVPPFYRPPGIISSDGRKTPPLRRSKNTYQQRDPSWDGSYSIKASHNQDPPPPPPPGTPGTPHDHQPRIPIKDQVKAIFNELGKPENDDPSKDLYLTMDNFVKITKDICNFPTFFNRPLYKRILFLWNNRHPNITLQRKIKLYDNFMSFEEDASTNTTAADGRTSPEETEKDPATTSNKPNKPLPEMEKWDKVISMNMFRWFWLEEMQDYDMNERFFRLLKKPHEDHIVREDFNPFIKELLRDHPGLEFLSSHAEFQDKYAVTVITRIFYSVNRCHSGRITLRQIKRSDLLSAFLQVDEEEDINKVTRYFSYEHFYVLYCRFWELDHDRDYKITREDLLRYGDQCLNHMIVDRIFDAAPRPFPSTAQTSSSADKSVASSDDGNDGNTENSKSKSEAKSSRDYLTYEDFIFFMLSEEDKANEISVRYWFTCIDVDGDGKLNNMEMRSFYALQQHRIQSFGHENVPFEDMLCQMIDMIKPSNEEYLIVEDFLQPECAQVSGALFDALFNLNKYLQFEQRDPFQERQKREDEFETDWDRFACMDYNRLAMEEEAREEDDALEIDWVTVDDDDDGGDYLDRSGKSQYE